MATNGKVMGSAGVPASTLQAIADKDPESNAALILRDYPHGYRDYTVRVPMDGECLTVGSGVNLNGD